MSELLTKEKLFKSEMKLLDHFECDEKAIKHEPMFFNADFNFAYENGGPITTAFLALFICMALEIYISFREWKKRDN